jgi:hypothetical protein
MAPDTDHRFLDLLVQTLGWVGGAGVPILGVWWGTRWIPKRWARIYARIVLAPAFVFVLFHPLGERIGGSVSEGEWQCLVCGAMEQRLTYFGWTLKTEAPKDVWEEGDSRPFERWYEREIRTPHEHDWVPVGCHESRTAFGGGIGCCKYPHHVYFRALPSLPNPALAASMVNRILHADEDGRLALLHSIGGLPSTDPFAAIAEGDPMTREEFDRAFEAWLVIHPDWR